MTARHRRAERAVVEMADDLVLVDAAVDRPGPQPSTSRTASPAAVSVPRSPPEPLTYDDLHLFADAGPTALALAEVLPPP